MNEKTNVSFDFWFRERFSQEAGQQFSRVLHPGFRSLGDRFQINPVGFKRNGGVFLAKSRGFYKLSEVSEYIVGDPNLEILDLTICDSMFLGDTRASVVAKFILRCG